MTAQVIFLPGWRTATDEEWRERDNLQKEMEIFRAEIEYCYGNLPDYKERKEMAHLRIRQIMGIVRKAR